MAIAHILFSLSGYDAVSTTFSWWRSSYKAANCCGTTSLFFPPALDVAHSYYTQSLGHRSLVHSLQAKHGFLSAAAAGSYAGFGFYHRSFERQAIPT
ncbi:hypothetical protein NUW54_g5779 [Trametes sanguinea]|uniref:Uncharacterized protein n=1 Tax=Trametes sanguinea TaxID=158606 RepID=A0ACC1PW74_9APHY|nr:hypothetical protein NUW54_g5779 [Trametes sanguinea]